MVSNRPIMRQNKIVYVDDVIPELWPGKYWAKVKKIPLKNTMHTKYKGSLEIFTDSTDIEKIFLKGSPNPHPTVVPQRATPQSRWNLLFCFCDLCCCSRCVLCSKVCCSQLLQHGKTCKHGISSTLRSNGALFQCATRALGLRCRIA